MIRSVIRIRNTNYQLSSSAQYGTFHDIAQIEPLMVFIALLVRAVSESVSS